jgi:heme exporter protein A
VIEVEGLVKTFGLKPVLRGLALEVPPGGFVTVVGPNGAGKTTLLRILATLSRPSGGRVRIAGYELPGEAGAVRQLLGVLSHQPLLYGELTAEENLRFFGRMYGVRRLDARIDEVLKQVGLSMRRRDLVRTFSRGMWQRLSIARAILHDPPLLLLDEPYTGLDPDASAMLDTLLREATGQGRTVLMTTHDLSRGLALADTVAILARGKIAFLAPRADVDAAHFSELYARVVSRAN